MTGKRTSETHARRTARRDAQDCIFCDIVARRGPASIVYEDDKLMGLMDTRPVNPGHVLVIPKEHRPNLADLDEETGIYPFRITLRLEQAVRRSGVKCDGIDLFLADAEAASREFPHIHLHIVPRYSGDAFRTTADWGHPTRTELDGIGARIQEACASLWASRPGASELTEG